MPPGTESENFIRITHEDANSEHVESLLRRQMSLRGEQGITAVKKRRWFYQSWFIQMLAAGLLAFAAWALIEPHFNDFIFVQGPIEQIGANQVGIATLQVGSHHILLFPRTQLWSDGKAAPLNPEVLKVGQEVRVYVKTPELQERDIALALFVDPAPKPVAASRASLTIPQLKQQQIIAALLLLPLVAGFVGVGVGAADGIVCRLPRRALLSGAVGLIVGLLGGFIASILAGLIYAPLNHLAESKAGDAERMTAFAFFIQVSGRGLAWMIAGMAMGLGQGIALRSKRLLLYGFLGGILGGLLGGLLFDPIGRLGGASPSGAVSRLVGLTVIGLSVGAMIGVVELLARNAWLRMTEGPLAGKEFLLFKDTMRIGSSSKSDIYLFNDDAVAPQHAIIRTISDQSEIESGGDAMVLVNTRPTRRARLRPGDQITIGRTSFIFQSRKG